MRHGHVALFVSLLSAMSACGDDDTRGSADPPAGDVDGVSGDGSEDAPDSGSEDIAHWLANQPGLSAKELPSDQQGYRRFELTLEQPTGHEVANGPTFEQRMVLHHRDEAAPMVLATTGYGLPSGEYLMEPTLLLSANQLLVEHRYFPPSIPDAPDWTTLTIRQSAEDFHRIALLFRARYGARWLSTGASKGGMTAVFHRRFFPDDVDATVGYVTPLSFGAPDGRYVSFLQSINPNGCGDDVRALQRRFITNRKALAELLRGPLGHGADFPTAEDAERFIIDAALSFDWGFWQFYGVDYCADVTTALVMDDAASRFLDDEAQFYQEVGPLWAYTYQTLNELGWQEISTAHLDDLLADIPPPQETEGELPPWGDTDPSYSPDAMRDVAAWLAKDAAQMLLIYGEYDPWTGGAIDLGTSKDAFKVIVPQGTHGASIDLLQGDARERALSALFRWADVARPTEESLAGSLRRRDRAAELRWSALPPQRGIAPLRVPGDR